MWSGRELRIAAAALRQSASGGLPLWTEAGDVSPVEATLIAAKLEQDGDSLDRASQFDAAVEVFRYDDTFPDDSWSYAGLVRFVRDSLLEVPWSYGGGSFKRTVWLSAALARLGEHGVSPDLLVRVGLKSELQARIQGRCAIAVAGFLPGGRGQGKVIVRTLQPWVAALYPALNLESGSIDEMPDRSGDFALVFREWLERAPIQDIFSWKLDCQFGKPDANDLWESGGAEGIRWLLDRYSKTHLDGWNESSLILELKYLLEPAGVSASVSLPSKILADRSTHQNLVVDALRWSTRIRNSNERLLVGFTESEFIDHAVGLISSGEIDGLRALLLDAANKAPLDDRVKSVWAFCLIPSDPNKALGLLSQLRLVPTISSDLLVVNELQCLMVLGGISALEERITEIRQLNSELEFYGWVPSDLVSGEKSPSQLFHGSYGEWSNIICGMILDS